VGEFKSVGHPKMPVRGKEKKHDYPNIRILVETKWIDIEQLDILKWIMKIQ
jgi:hypothetical protein